MLAGLLLLFVSVPVIQSYRGDVALIVMYIALTVTLGISVWSLAGSTPSFRIGLSFVILSILPAVIDLYLQYTGMGYLVLALHLMFWGICARVAARALLAPGKVDLNRIAGSICIYLMAGFIWAYLYAFQVLMEPGSFKGVTAVTLQEKLPELAYHSFVTLTTLGYGDITPVTPFARVLVNLEAIFGQFYIAILVAALVGIHITSRTESKNATGSKD